MTRDYKLKDEVIDKLECLANNLDSIKSVTKYAQVTAVEQSDETRNNTYVNLRINAFEGIFMLLNTWVQGLDNQINDILERHNNLI